MSQHDMNIANAANPSLRADLNNALVALASLSSGSSAPSSPTTNQLWLDTTFSPYMLKYYDGTDWIVIGAVHASGNLAALSCALYGCGVSNNSGDANNDIDFAAGWCLADDNATVMMT